MHESEPLPEVVAAAGCHLAEAHGRASFDPERELTYPGHERAPALVVYLAETPRAAAGFACEICRERVFPVEPSYGHPARNAQLLRDHPELETTLLRGVGNPDERALLLEDWDRGRIGQAQAIEARRRRGMATRRAARPVVEERRRRCQAFLLENYVALGTKEAAIGALIALARHDPPAHERLTGRPTPLAPSTLNGYWKLIPLAERARARAQRDGGVARS